MIRISIILLLIFLNTFRLHGQHIHIVEKTGIDTVYLDATDSLRWCTSHEPNRTYWSIVQQIGRHAYEYGSMPSKGPGKNWYAVKVDYHSDVNQWSVTQTDVQMSSEGLAHFTVKTDSISLPETSYTITENKIIFSNLTFIYLYVDDPGPESYYSHLEYSGFTTEFGFDNLPKRCYELEYGAEGKTIKFEKK